MAPRERASCPHCGAAAQSSRDRGQVYPCVACGAWLYVGLWDGESPDRCDSCGCAQNDVGECLYCDTVATRSSSLFKRLMGWLLGKRTIRLVPLDRIVTDAIQPRIGMNVHKFDALRHSIAQIGIIQPVLLRPVNEQGEYEVVSGQRRLMAARHLGWPRVPARILTVSEEQAHAIRLAENVHREELSPIEIAESFERYFAMEGSGDREQVAERLGIDVGVLDALLTVLTQVEPKRERA
ncbi:MAG: ParB/RepB/Spo0J family partition protein [Planctomycetota bacterium]